MEQMRAKEIIQKLEILSPLQYAEKWDNSGWQCGRGEKEVQKILLAVDATDEVVDEAILSEADLLITHHPLRFKDYGSGFYRKTVVEIITGGYLFIRHAYEF